MTKLDSPPATTIDGDMSLQINTDLPQADGPKDLQVDETKEVTTKPPLRRSCRRPTKGATAAASLSSVLQRSKAMNELRRNPKRKASEASHVANLPDNLLEEALAPLSTKDIEDWEGWIELESEPAFFNIILRDLGVKDVKAQEIFTLDQDSMAMLPKPVFGLIFLFQYMPTPGAVSQDVDTSKVWFANQTTENACATVALLNIVMNSVNVDLGPNLTSFKAQTQHLSTPLRGYQLSNDKFIRSIHNSFTRRMDHLNADLHLENEISDAKMKKAKKRATLCKRPRKGASSRKKVSSDYGFHFIAYVPAGGYVWELDGLKSEPHRLDAAAPDGDWTEVARPQIEARMLQYEESQLSFNLIALCRSPLASHSRNIAQSAASLSYLHTKMKDDPTFDELISAEKTSLDAMKEACRDEIKLEASDIESAPVPESLQEQVSNLGAQTSEAYELHQQLLTDTKAAIGEYRAEMIAVADDEQRVKSRRKDYGPALHRWMAKLAEKGVLEDMIKSSQ